MLLTEIGIPGRTAKALEKKKIITEEDLLRYLPTAYRDYSKITDIRDVVSGEYYALMGTLIKTDVRVGKKRYLYACVESGNEKIHVFYFAGTYMNAALSRIIGKRVVVCGKITIKEGMGYTISDPDYFTETSAFTPKIKTVYRKVKGVSDKNLERIITDAADMCGDILESRVYAGKYMNYGDALRTLHMPGSMAEIETARKRLIFNDLLYFNTIMKMSEEKLSDSSSVKFSSFFQTGCFIQSLPYSLTDDQDKVITKIRKQASEGKRINMLLQGDVGCGKTIVAIVSMMMAQENGYQSVLMAPREVLARQHYEEIKSYADAINIKSAFLSSGMKASERKKVLAEIASGEISFIIGTHSCISKDVKYKKLGLVVTDEEHLFGVNQKEDLAKKAAEGAHVISMSATPIPKTLANVVYGTKKEIAIISTMPAGRIPIQTAYQKAHKNTFEFMLKEINKGHQCYVVCPAIEESENTDLVSIEEVETAYKAFFEPYGIPLAVVHGKMKKEETDETIRQFKDNQVKILISTTVIEVGVNVPNATVMVIEQADRFGLASLHQLRGRVGRSSFPSYCILVADERCDRINTMLETTDGFKIAEADMKQRGIGDLIGVRQSGTNRYVEELLQHPDIYKDACKAADYCIANDCGKRLVQVMSEHERILASDQ